MNDIGRAYRNYGLTLILPLISLFCLTSCSPGRHADEEVLICSDYSHFSEYASEELGKFASRHDYVYRDTGRQAKQSLVDLDANPDIIPSGVAVMATIRRSRDQVIVVASNIGSGFEDFRVSLFFGGDFFFESPQYFELMSILTSLPGAQILDAQDELHDGVCGG